MVKHTITLGGNLNAVIIGKCPTEPLAPELLSMIFHEVTALDQRNPSMILPTAPESLPEDNEMVTKSLLTVTHVCRYWRDVALGNPALWQRIHGRRHDQMQVFLQRSQPLTVSLFLAVVHWGTPEEGPISAPMESVMKACGARLRRLDLLVVPARQNIAPLLASLQANRLEVLTISSPCMRYTSSGLASSTMTRDLLLNGETSSLKALAIMPIVDWLPSHTPFPHLTHLFISYDDEPGLPHPFDVLELLSNTPVLEFLYVDRLNFDGPYSGSWHPAPPGVPLPRLRSLTFTTCSYYLMLQLISWLVLPEDIFIRLQGMDIDIVSPHEGYFAALPHFPIQPVTSLDISMEEYGPSHVHMVADGPTSGLWWDGYYDGPDELAFACWKRWLLRLHTTIPLLHVTHLQIQLNAWSVFPPELLQQLPQVSNLSVLVGPFAKLDDDSVPPQGFAGTRVGSPLDALCRALSPNITEPLATSTTVPTAASRILCPALHTLLVDWQAKRITIECTAACLSIRDMLAARARAGFPLPHISLQTRQRALSPELGISELLDLLEGGGRVAPEPTGGSSSLGTVDGTETETKTEYNVTIRGEGEEGLYKFKIRDVWKVEGEDKYWKLGDEDLPEVERLSSP